MLWLEPFLFVPKIYVTEWTLTFTLLSFMISPFHILFSYLVTLLQKWNASLPSATDLRVCLCGNDVSSFHKCNRKRIMKIEQSRYTQLAPGSFFFEKFPFFFALQAASAEFYFNIFFFFFGFRNRRLNIYWPSSIINVQLLRVYVKKNNHSLLCSFFFLSSFFSDWGMFH